MNDNRIEETAPWWFPVAVLLIPISIGVTGWLLNDGLLLSIALIMLFFEAGIGITIETIFKNKTNYNIGDLALFDAAWHVFIVQRRSRRKQ